MSFASRRGLAAVATGLALLVAATPCAPRDVAARRRRQTPRAQAPIDLTGYWVAIISEDWRWRMVTPSRGDFPSIPINLAAQKIAEAWDPAKDEAAGEQCKAYGAPGLMRGPTRLHITWLDDDTLKLETDYGMQTRLFEFGATSRGTAKPSWQGASVAQWVMAGGGRRRAAAARGLGR